ncbi:uncharacterized protein LOC115073808 isoform X2 [Rhinatrema bivittatum]|uniref:uncharacterized protein LOC115073808 isoform X2 n=1 Tax=Rhinatrema bivittatum TaxID=194408 RepID=UPI00112CF988|nr:uncharacterized protein LOC115073808 isoform X2 [Rhinatrema bivittatum]
MTCRIQNIVHILFIFCFPELFSVQAMSSLPLPNEMENTGMVSSDSENVSLSPSRSVTSINRILEHHASTNWSTAATTSTSPNVTELSNLTTVSYFTTNTTNNKDTTPSDATGRFSTEATPSVTVYDPLKIPTTQGINPNITVSEITMLSSTDKLPTTQPNISVVTKQITKSFDALSTSQMSGNEFRLKNNEAILTIVFSIILGIVVVVLIIYSVNKYRKRRSQYSHRPLHDTSYESVVIIPPEEADGCETRAACWGQTTVIT